MKWIAVASALGLTWLSLHVESRAAVLSVTALAFTCLALARPRLRFETPGRVTRR